MKIIRVHDIIPINIFFILVGWRNFIFKKKMSDFLNYSTYWQFFPSVLIFISCKSKNYYFFFSLFERGGVYFGMNIVSAYFNLCYWITVPGILNEFQILFPYEFKSGKFASVWENWPHVCANLANLPVHNFSVRQDQA